MGLLLMRLVLGSMLVARAGSVLWSGAPLGAVVTAASLAGLGVLLIPGLWTPIVGAIIALLESWQFITIAGDRAVPLLLGTMAGALAMLGPGFWSVDARLFGWKRVVPPARKLSSV